MGGEISLLYTVAEAFGSVGYDAERIADGEKGLRDLSPGGFLAKLVERVKAWAGPIRKDALPLAVPLGGEEYPDPLAEFSGTVETLRRLEEMGGRAAAWRLAADCKVCRAVAYVRADSIIERETIRAEAGARVAAVRAELAKVKGNKAAQRKWARKAKAERDAGKALEAHRCVYKGDMTIAQTAEKLSVSVRTIETRLKLARDLMGIEPRKRGRRKSVKEERGAGEMEKAEREAGKNYKWKQDPFYRNLDGDGEDGEA